jgi:4-aminobutyrate aminotransferase-like enzyme
VLAERQHYVASPQLHYYIDPPEIERGYRHTLYDEHGRAYVDVVNNVAILGHSHPAVERAAARQLRLLNTNSRFLYGALPRFARRLAALVPDPLEVVLLVSSGSEANDLALRLARAATGERDVLCVGGNYHGWTEATFEVSTSLFDNPRGDETRPPWIHPILSPNTYRGPHRGDDAGERYAGDARRALEDIRTAGRGLAALISEPVLGNQGGMVPPAGYTRAVVELVRAAGGLYIADEVQVGYGRLGHVFWAFEHEGVVPDIVTIAKSTGNGYPVAAVITTREIADAFGRDASWFSSMGGNPVACEVGLAVLDAMEAEGVQENARVVGDNLKARLDALAERHALIGAVHGLGLYLGVELVRDRTTREPAAAEAYALCERLRELGVIMQPTGDHENILKVKPPLVITQEAAGFFADQLDRALTEGW